VEAAQAEATEAAQAVTAEADMPEAAPSAQAEAAAVEEPSAEIAEPNDSADSFAEAFEKTLVRIRNGQVLTGTVVQVTESEVCVNIGYKSDGFIPRNEFSSDPDVNPMDVVKVGDSIEVEVTKVNDGEGNVLLSRKSVESKKLWRAAGRRGNEGKDLTRLVKKSSRAADRLHKRRTRFRARIACLHKYVENSLTLSDNHETLRNRSGQVPQTHRRLPEKRNARGNGSGEKAKVGCFAGRHQAERRCTQAYGFRRVCGYRRH
jgi:transcriptional accessory protein Tex/SPT6